MQHAHCRPTLVGSAWAGRCQLGRWPPAVRHTVGCAPQRLRLLGYNQGSSQSLAFPAGPAVSVGT